jgi:hypothetical protein
LVLRFPLWIFMYEGLLPLENGLIFHCLCHISFIFRNRVFTCYLSLHLRLCFLWTSFLCATHQQSLWFANMFEFSPQHHVILTLATFLLQIMLE